MIRIFFALPVPEKIKSILVDIQEEFKKRTGNIKWVRPSGIHLTLKFIGDVKPERARQLWEALEEVDYPEFFNISLQRSGVFPNPRRPRVLWIGINGSMHLESIASKMDSRLLQEGVDTESRKFHPHLTIGRIRNKIDDQVVESFLNTDVPDVSMEVNSIICYKSELKPGGAVYTPLHTIQFHQSKE